MNLSHFTKTKCDRKLDYARAADKIITYKKEFNDKYGFKYLKDTVRM